MQMIDWKQARTLILSLTHPIGASAVKVGESLGRTLAERIIAPFDLPPFDNSAMDGFAVRAEDVIPSSKFKILGEVRAGGARGVGVERGIACRIMTGGQIPTGADSVIKVEDAVVQGDQVEFPSGVKIGANIRHAGEDLKKGVTVFEEGERIDAAGVGMLAALGFPVIQTTLAPRVGILPTGDELLEAGDPYREGSIYESNGPMLRAFVLRDGGVATKMPIVTDDRERLRAALSRLRDFDLCLTSGGVSAGSYDFVPEELKKLGAEIHFHKIAIRPGKPLLFATLGKTLIFGLPGNPVSTAVVYELFVAPALRKMCGRREILPAMLQAELEEPLSKKAGLAYFVRGVISEREGKLVVRSTGPQGSHLLTSWARANALICLEAELGDIPNGSRVSVLPLARDFPFQVKSLE
jgi:molybdopterin molybdotransferase